MKRTKKKKTNKIKIKNKNNLVSLLKIKIECIKKKKKIIYFYKIVKLIKFLYKLGTMHGNVPSTDINFSH